MRLFIVDDSEILRERLVEILSEIESVEIVGQEGDTFKAVEAIERLKPDLVILDIRMPGGNGIVIMFTNFPYLQYRKRCFDSGADYFFYKSTEFEKLVDVVRESAEAQVQR